MFQIIRIASYIMLAWFLVAMVARVHWLLLLVLTVVAVINVVVAYMLREHHPVLAKLCRSQWSKYYLSWICFFTNARLSLDETQNKQPSLQLHSAHDFELASKRAKQFVRGQNDVLDSVLSRIHENLALRKTQKKANISGPLASFLLVGQEGIGKRHVSRVVSKLLYGCANVQVFNCGQLSGVSLAGTQTQVGKLFEIVNRTPCAVILFEDIERAEDAVVSTLVDLLTTGSLTQPGGTKRATFHETTIVFTSRRISELSCKRDIPRDPIGLATGEIQVDPRIAEAVTEVCLLLNPNDLVKAEVVALQMQKQCVEHGVRLSNVAPSILATQVLQITEEEGFQFVPQRVKKLIRKPLVAAASHNATQISLRIRPQSSN